MKYLGLITSLIVNFSCSDTLAFQGDKRKGASPAVSTVEDSPQSMELEVVPIQKVDFIQVDNGLVSGHFDVDTSLEIYNFDVGDTSGHVHGYDDDFNVNGIDALDLKTNSLADLRETVSGKKFRIFLVNTKLSPSAQVAINQVQTKATDFAAKLNGKEVYSLDKLADTVEITKLQLVFPLDSLLKSGLVKSTTGCVQKNVAGKNGEYRNGALLLQIADADNFTLDEKTGALLQGLLWELSIFWHHKDADCSNK